VIDRVALGMLVPMAAAVITVLLIAGIGSLLLWLSHGWGEAVAVAVALALGGAVLVGCALAARGGRPEHPAPHH
jgi:hypothetical protein